MSKPDEAKTKTPAPHPLPEESPNLLPHLTRGRPSAAAAPAKSKPSVLQFQTRPGNKSMSIDALLASIDQEVEAGAGDLAPADGDTMADETAAAVAALRGKIQRHGDQRGESPTS